MLRKPLLVCEPKKNEWKHKALQRQWDLILRIPLSSKLSCATRLLNGTRGLALLGCLLCYSESKAELLAFKQRHHGFTLHKRRIRTTLRSGYQASL